jgi:hypothetical protein
MLLNELFSLPSYQSIKLALEAVKPRIESYYAQRIEDVKKEVGSQTGLKEWLEGEIERFERDKKQDLETVEAALVKTNNHQAVYPAKLKFLSSNVQILWDGINVCYRVK